MTSDGTGRGLAPPPEQIARPTAICADMSIRGIKRLVLTVTVLAALVMPAWSACSAAEGRETSLTGTPSLAAGDYDRGFEYQGWSRSYHLHVPPGYRPGTPTPLVLSFHGGGGNARAQERTTGLSTKADSAGFILVEPDGIPNLLLRRLKTWNVGNCCGRAKKFRSDDVGFVRAILDRTASELSIDPRRIYATGLSNGAMFSYRLACELSDRIAAIAPVAGGMGDRDLDSDPPKVIFDCKPSRPVPILHLHGLADQCYHFDGGKSRSHLTDITFASIPDTIAGWVARNRCSGETVRTYSRGKAKCETYQGCAAGADIVLCTIAGGGHTWPGRPYPAWLRWVCKGDGTTDLNANDMIWDFFKAHPMPRPRNDSVASAAARHSQASSRSAVSR